MENRMLNPPRLKRTRAYNPIPIDLLHAPRKKPRRSRILTKRRPTSLIFVQTTPLNAGVDTRISSLKVLGDVSIFEGCSSPSKALAEKERMLSIIRPLSELKCSHESRDALKEYIPDICMVYDPIISIMVFPHRSKIWAHVESPDPWNLFHFEIKSFYTLMCQKMLLKTIPLNDSFPNSSKAVPKIYTDEVCVLGNPECTNVMKRGKSVCVHVIEPTVDEMVWYWKSLIDSSYYLKILENHRGGDILCLLRYMLHTFPCITFLLAHRIRDLCVRLGGLDASALLRMCHFDKNKIYPSLLQAARDEKVIDWLLTEKKDEIGPLANSFMFIAASAEWKSSNVLRTVLKHLEYPEDDLRIVLAICISQHDLKACEVLLEDKRGVFGKLNFRIKYNDAEMITGFDLACKYASTPENEIDSEAFKAFMKNGFSVYRTYKVVKLRKIVLNDFLSFQGTQSLLSIACERDIPEIALLLLNNDTDITGEELIACISFRSWRCLEVILNRYLTRKNTDREERNQLLRIMFENLPLKTAPQVKALSNEHQVLEMEISEELRKELRWFFKLAEGRDISEALIIPDNRNMMCCILNIASIALTVIEMQDLLMELLLHTVRCGSNDIFLELLLYSGGKVEDSSGRDNKLCFFSKGESTGRRRWLRYEDMKDFELRYRQKENLFLLLVRTGKVEMFESMIKANLDVFQYITRELFMIIKGEKDTEPLAFLLMKNAQTLPHEIAETAARRNWVRSLEYLSTRLDLNTPDIINGSASESEVETVRVLYNLGVKYNRTALFHATSMGNRGVVAFLMNEIEWDESDIENVIDEAFELRCDGILDDIVTKHFKEGILSSILVEYIFQQAISYKMESLATKLCSNIVKLNYLDSRRIHYDENCLCCLEDEEREIVDTDRDAMDIVDILPKEDNTYDKTSQVSGLGKKMVLTAIRHHEIKYITMLFDYGVPLHDTHSVLEYAVDICSGDSTILALVREYTS